MDVHLLVYDLSRGLAQQMSVQLLGFELKAIYHTSIQLNGLEYVYDGSIISIIPGSSHLGRPMEQIHLGKTELPMDVIEEYLDSLREIYTVEAYDLWKNNCNNFSNDLSTFLLGKGIPDHIINMPQAVLDSPLGQALLPMLNQQVNANRRGGSGGIWGIQGNNNSTTPTPSPAAGGSVKPKAQLHHPEAQVREAYNLQELDALLAEAQGSCAVVFFTSQTCAPCRTLYPAYDELAAEVGRKGVLIKVDTGRAFDAASRYSVSATPTFVTFLRGAQENRWSGADPAALRGNVKLLVQMAWPPHPHDGMNLPTFSFSDSALISKKMALFSKVPPLDKLAAKMGGGGNDAVVQGVMRFVRARGTMPAADASLPDVAGFAAFVRASVEELPPGVLFAVVDLLRCGLVDPRFSGCLAEEKAKGDEKEDHATILSILDRVNTLGSECPYALRLVTLQAACNLFSSPLWPEQIFAPEHAALRAAITQLVSASLLFEDSSDQRYTTVRVAAASLLRNLALANAPRRRDGPPGEALPEADQVELAASVVEAIGREREEQQQQQKQESGTALDAMLLALGWLVYRMPVGGELAEVLGALDAKETVVGAQTKGKGSGSGSGSGLVGEVERMLSI